ncbi:MAG: hypothetical protein H6Q65_50 [Firmicutes bacterium]|nr:hypothetical protein [Bacillota bacterium]
MKQQELLGKLEEALFEPAGTLTLSTELDGLDGWDSLGRLSIAALFHETFGLTVETSKLKQCASVEDIVNFVEDKLEEEEEEPKHSLRVC